MEKRELSKAEWLDKAEAYCARSEHCAFDLRRKFREWQVPEETARAIEESLYQNDFLNDARFCRAYVHDKVAYQAWGRMKIQAGLRALELPDKSIREALAQIDETQYTRNLRSLLTQRKADPEDKRLRFLLQRGFTYAEIQKSKS